MIVTSIQNQSKQIFQNIELIFDAIDDTQFQQKMGVFFIWKHVYHLLHSMDKHFIDPTGYAEPVFQTKNLDVMYLEQGEPLSKEFLRSYYLQVKTKIESYLSTLSIELFEEKITINGNQFAKLELILAQFRHIFYHVGYLHCCIKIENGQTPEYVGLYKRIPD